MFNNDKLKAQASDDNIRSETLWDIVVNRNTGYSRYPDEWQVFFQSEYDPNDFCPLCGWVDDPYAISDEGFRFQIEGQYDQKPLTVGILGDFMAIYPYAYDVPIVAVFKDEDHKLLTHDTYYDIVDVLIDENNNRLALIGRERQ